MTSFELYLWTIQKQWMKLNSWLMLQLLYEGLVV